MTETIGWRRAREMKVEERNKELKERLISRWNDQRGMSEERDVRKILLDIVPCDGSGLEVFAKTVDDVRDKLTEMSIRLDEAETKLATPPTHPKEQP